jgi:hypothetical protein
MRDSIEFFILRLENFFLNIMKELSEISKNCPKETRW